MSRRRASTPPFALTVKVTFPRARSRYPERRERSSREEREQEREERGLSPSSSRVTQDTGRRRRRSHSRSRSRTSERRERSSREEREREREERELSPLSSRVTLNAERRRRCLHSRSRLLRPSAKNAAAVKKENGKGRKGSFHPHVHGSRSTPPFLRTQCQGHVPPSAENAAAVVKKP